MAKMASNGSDSNVAPRMFEFHDGKSDKFWEIELAGDSHTVRYGRSGTDGQTKTKEFADEAKARASYEKLIGEKTKKGYQEVADVAQSRTEQIKAAKQNWKEHEPFLAEIFESPDDVGGYSVYADWLSEQGDPRGEFIAVQVQLEDESLPAASRKKLRAAEKKLLKEHERDWLGDLAMYFLDDAGPKLEYHDCKFSYTFARGFVDSLTVGTLLPEFSRVLKQPQHAQLLRRLVIRDAPRGWDFEESEAYADAEWDEDSVPGLAALGGAKFTNLRHFELSENEGPQTYRSCHLSAEGIENLIKNMPLLETLHLEAHDVEAEKIFKLKLPRLRSLAVHHIHGYPLEVLAKNKSLANLESICFYPHAHEYDDDGAYIKLEGFRALCRSKNLPNLKHVELNCSDVGNDGIAELAKSPLLGQLRVLDLSHGRINDEVVDVLSKADLSGLDKLVLSGNYLTKSGINAIKKTGVNLEAQNQYSGNPDDELEYLWHGDIE